MGHLRKAGWVGVAAAMLACPAGCPAAWADDPKPPRLYLPFAYPPDGSGMMGEAHAGPRSAVPGVTGPLVPTPATPQAKTPEDRSQAQILDDLFGRLAATQDAGEARALASQIGHLWLRSGSDTADLVMSRAVEAYRKGRQSVALALLDRLVTLRPEWAEAWDKRAFVRFLGNDQTGAMGDIAHVLSLEPRHFVAMAGMAMLLERQGMKAQALAVMRRAAAIYPTNRNLRQMIERLAPLVEGRPI